MANSKKYKKLLPFNENRSVKDQFGFLPTSILNPSKKSKSKWKWAYFNQDWDSERRRPGNSKNSKYSWTNRVMYSEFHAGLAENIIRYWSLKNSTVVDPFSGRATRAIVASQLQRKYFGYEISPFTLERSKKQIEIANVNMGIPKWAPTLFNDDGCLLNNTPDESADLVFTCPPYWNIEEYEDVPNQLSEIKSYDTFLEKIKLCGDNICRVLKPGAFCVWVCADFRGWHGTQTLYTFHVDSLELFKASNLSIHDIIILQNQSPFAPLQAGKCAAKRYTAKTHEYILVFKKPGEYEIPDYCESDELNNDDANIFLNYE